MKIITICASLRKDSINRKLLKIASAIAANNGAQVEHVELKDFEMPLYSQDIEEKGIPANVTMLEQKISNADAVIIASPEYNFSIPGVLKNAVDWTSRVKPQPYKGKQILLISASPSMVGGNRGLWALRMPLEALGAHVYPEMFSLSVAHEAFDAQDMLKNEKLNQDIQRIVKSFVEYV